MATQPSMPLYVTNKKWASMNGQTQNIDMSLEYVQTQITAAQLNLLKTTPIILVPAGTLNAGEVIIVDKIVFNYQFKTAAFTLNAGTLKVFMGLVANANPMTADLSATITQTASGITFTFPTVLVRDVYTKTAQVPIYLGNDGAANFSLGDSFLTVTIYFSRSTP